MSVYGNQKAPYKIKNILTPTFFTLAKQPFPVLAVSRDTLKLESTDTL